MSETLFLVRFLEQTPSDHPDWPLQPGQVIPIAAITPQVNTWITPRPDGRRSAVLYREVVALNEVDGQ